MRKIIIITTSILIVSLFACKKEVYFIEDNWDVNLPKDLYFEKDTNLHYTFSIPFHVSKSTNPPAWYRLIFVEMQKSEYLDIKMDITYVRDTVAKTNRYIKDFTLKGDIILKNNDERANFPQKMTFNARYINKESVLYVFKREFVIHLKD